MFAYHHHPRDPDSQPHVFKPTKRPVWMWDYTPVDAWCREHFGAPGLRWITTAHHFFFRDADDAFAFKMRWC